MASKPVRYRSPDEDSARWLGFEHRDGDIVISTRSKSGTTWVQMICALLVFGTSELPKPLAELSPWLDWLVVPEDAVKRSLAEQTHRRFIKTHTPLDGLPLDDRVSYIVVGRHPLDAAVSLYHQGDNLDRQRIAELVGDAAAADRPARPPIDEWLGAWIASDVAPGDELDSIRGVFHHLTDAWDRRAEANVTLVHYDDLLADLHGQMRVLAHRLDIETEATAIDDLASAASFDSMKARSHMLAPDPAGVLEERSAFFRCGSSGGAKLVLGADDLAAYHARAASLAPRAFLQWLHRP